MYSVTKRVRTVQQPAGGYIPPEMFQEVQFEDNIVIHDVPAAMKAIQGLVVDYMTRYISGCPIEKAFRISLKGAEVVDQSAVAQQLLNNISGLDQESIINACKLAGYDVAYRFRRDAYLPTDTELIDEKMISNIQIMVNRSILFFQNHGPIISDGFTMEGGYNGIISSGDGDFLTRDTLWDFKTSVKPLTREQTLQVAVYYIMGVHSVHTEFDFITKLGIFNPLLNKMYILPIHEITDDIMSEICHNVIGYKISEDVHEWRLSSGTDPIIYDKTFGQIFDSVFKDTGFRPKKYKDGIYDITVDDYWTYYRKFSDTPYEKPRFMHTVSVKFLKNQGYTMFVAVSDKGKYAILQGGRKRNLKYPIEYYYIRMPEYANTILNLFSKYWRALYSISKQVRAIEPAPQIGACNEPFSGKVHGCIVDLDFTNHLYLNPIDGSIIPYSAFSIYDRHVYRNIASLVADQRPEMLEGLKKLSSLPTGAENRISGQTSVKMELMPVDKDNIEKILNTEFEEYDDEIETKHIRRGLNTDMYDISNRMKTLQKIYDHNLIAVWYDDILPYRAIEGVPQPAKQSLLGQTKKMKCGMAATVIKDYDYNNIAVQFEDGTIVNYRTRKMFRDGTIKNPNLPDPPKTKRKNSESNHTGNKGKKVYRSYVGKTGIMNCGHRATVIEDFGCNDITIQFDDGLVRKHCRRDKFRDGKIAHKPDSEKSAT